MLLRGKCLVKSKAIRHSSRFGYWYRSTQTLTRIPTRARGTLTHLRCGRVVGVPLNSVPLTHSHSRALSTGSPGSVVFYDTVVGDMIYRQIESFSDNYIYFIHDTHNNKTAVVDPGEAEPVLEGLSEWGWALDTILLTHHHDDHIGGVKRIKEKTGCKVYGNSIGLQRLPGVDVPVDVGQVYNVCGKQCHVLDLPGHTSDHIGFWFPEDRVVFVGDTLFAAGCGRLFEGTPAQMWNSLSALAKLPDHTMVFCGHEYTLSNFKFALHIDPTNDLLQQRDADCKKKRNLGKPTVPFTLKEDLATNPFLLCEHEAFRERVGLTNHSPVDAFADIRRQKDTF